MPGYRNLWCIYLVFGVAFVLPVSGGVAGILVGIAAALLLARAAGWEMVFSGTPMILASVSSVVIGLLFGTIPARRASRANPATSLRS